MPENKIPQPRNIFEVINQNIYNLGLNQKTTMDEIAAARKEIAELRAMFNPPALEQPNAASGKESDEKE